MNYDQAIKLAKATPVTKAGEYFGRTPDGQYLRLESGDVGFSDRDFSSFVLRVRGSVVELWGPGVGFVETRQFGTELEAWQWSAEKADQAALKTDRDILALGRAEDPVLFGRRD